MKASVKTLSVFFMLLIASVLTTLPAWGADNSAAKDSPASQKSAMVSINTATAKELSKNLKGIGMAKAEAIVAYRDSNGEFKKVEDLLKVKGIGKQTLENNKGRISL